jgi:ATPase family associated with various cellular activities (AAA)
MSNPDDRPRVLKEVVLAGHNLSAWMIIPNDTGFPVSAIRIVKQWLGPEVLRVALKAMLKKRFNHQNTRVHVEKSIPISPNAGLKLNDRGKDSLSATSEVTTGGSDGALVQATSEVPPSCMPEGASRHAWVLQRYLAESGEKRQGLGHAIRIDEFREFSAHDIDLDHPVMTFSPLPKNIKPKTLVVIGLDPAQSIPTSFEDLIPKGGTEILLLYFNTDQQLGERRREELSGYIAACRNRFGERLIILVNSRFFGMVGLSLVEDSSWETLVHSLITQGSKATAPAIVMEMRKCHEVIIRHQYSSALWVTKSRLDQESGYERNRRLHYLVEAKPLGSPPGGDLIGYNLLFALALVESLLDLKDLEPSLKIAGGINAAIYRSAIFASRGYAKKDACEFDYEWLNTISLIPCKQNTVHQVKMPYRDDGSLNEDQNWSVLVLLLEKYEEKGYKNKHDYALGIAGDIVRNGVLAAQEEHRFPIARFGEMIVTDRRTYEDYWEIHEAISQYLRAFRRGPSSKKQKPLSLAVFGAPGGGKSYGMKKLAEAIGRGILDSPYEVNVSQFTSVDDLAVVFEHVQKVSLSGKVPFVFFDEFDASLENRTFGWLRYFLAPMQDGEFGSGPKLQQFLRAIFVFIGGVNHSFEILNSRMLNREFIEAKGPDFISRLARHLDVLGIDAPRDGDLGYLLRRALFIRDKIQMYHRQIMKFGGPGKDLKVDIRDDVLNALLGVERFKHGARSLEAIIQNSRIDADNSIFHWGALPPQDQLEMHVSFRDFFNEKDKDFSLGS